MPINKNNKSKWQEASNLINKYRWDLANTLKSFDDEERQSQLYKDLIRDIKTSAFKAIRDVSPTLVEEVELDFDDVGKELGDRINWKSPKLWFLILSSPALIELIRFIVELCTKGH